MKILYLPSQYSQQRQREKKRWIWPVHLAMEATWHYRNGCQIYWNDVSRMHIADRIISEIEGIPFLDLPHPNRFLTDGFNKKYQNNGNFKYRPGTYIKSANGCWWGKCKFCAEKGIPWQVREVEDVIEEVKECKWLGFREVFDDSGTFPTGRWMEEFCDRMEGVGGVRLGCNMRMVDIDYRRMRSVGFRMVLFGMESANQKTLDYIQKGVKVDDVRYVVKAAHQGLDCHVAVMFGYPHETDDDAVRTLRLVWWLLKKGYAKTAQAAFYTPPHEKGNEAHRKYVNRIYWAAMYPRFWYHKLRMIHDVDDVKYFWRQMKEGLSCWSK